MSVEMDMAEAGKADRRVCARCGGNVRGRPQDGLCSKCRKEAGSCPSPSLCPKCGKRKVERDGDLCWECTFKKSLERTEPPRSSDKCAGCGRKLAKKSKHRYCWHCMTELVRGEMARRHGGKCKNCGAPLPAHAPVQRQLCDACRELGANGAMENSLPPGRKCHTCGKPTDNYWCDACRARRMRPEGHDFTGYRLSI